MDEHKLELELIHHSLHWFIIIVATWLELESLDLELWLLEFGNVIMKVDLELWLFTSLFDFGNVIMKV